MKRTISKAKGKEKPKYDNIYAEVLGANGEPVLISPPKGTGELPSNAKNAKDKNYKQLGAALAKSGKNEYTMDLVWAVAAPKPQPKPEPKKEPVQEFFEQQKKEYEQKIALMRKNKHLHKPKLNENIFLDIPFADNDKSFQNPQAALLALRDIAATIDVYRNDAEFQKLTIEIVITTPMFSTDTVGFSLTYKYSQLMEERASTVRSALILMGVPNAANIKITPKYNVQGTQRFLFKYVKP